MKNVILPFLLTLVSLSCGRNAIEPQEFVETHTEYYWAGGQKIYLTLDRTAVIAIEKGSRTTQILRFARPQFGSLRSLISAKGFDPDQFEWFSFGYTHNGHQFLPTNRVSFALKQIFTFNDLDPLIQGEATYDQTAFGTISLKVLGQEGDVFHVANKVQESGIVEYSCPDFIAQIQHANGGAS